MGIIKVETVLNIITIFVLALFIVTWVKIKIKFANNRKEAIRFFRSSFFRFIALIVNLISVLFMGYFFLLSGTASRLEIITVVLIFFSFAMQLSLLMDRNIFDALKR